MITSFAHKGLERFFREGVMSGINAQHESRLRLILARLHSARSARDMELPGLRLHRLKGKKPARWSVSVSANWRVTFSFDGPDATKVDYEDYH